LLLENVGLTSSSWSL